MSCDEEKEDDRRRRTPPVMRKKLHAIKFHHDDEMLPLRIQSSTLNTYFIFLPSSEKEKDSWK